MSYTNLFFTVKNLIVIILLLYRLVVVHIEKRKEAAEADDFQDTTHHLLYRDRTPPDTFGCRLADTASLSHSTCSGKSRFGVVQSGSSNLSNGFYNTVLASGSSGVHSVSRCTTPHRDDNASVGSIASLSRGMYEKRFVRLGDRERAGGGGGGGGSSGGGVGGGSVGALGGGDSGLSNMGNYTESNIDSVDAAVTTADGRHVIGGGPQAWNRLNVTTPEDGLSSPV
jgi:hypothetical protein